MDEGRRGSDPGSRIVAVRSSTGRFRMEGTSVGNAADKGAAEEDPIDVVITWVDGADPDHAARRATHADRHHRSTATAASRFSDNAELLFSLASIARFAPWAARVLIVTDGQTPPYLETVLKAYGTACPAIEVVSHHEVFRGHEDVLPTFSSRTIETMLHRIDGLSERFVYLNDDFMLARPMRPSDFFDGSKPIIRGARRPIVQPLALSGKRLARRLVGRPERPGFNAAQMEGARLARDLAENDPSPRPTSDFIAVGHWPHPMRRSTLQRFFDRHPERLRAQIAHRFRDSRQFSPIGLANALERAKDAPVRPPPSTAYFTPSKPKTREFKTMLDGLLAGSFDNACVQSVDLMDEVRRNALMRALETRYGVKTARR